MINLVDPSVVITRMGALMCLPGSDILSRTRHPQLSHILFSFIFVLSPCLKQPFNTQTLPRPLLIVYCMPYYVLELSAQRAGSSTCSTNHVITVVSSSQSSSSSHSFLYMILTYPLSDYPSFPPVGLWKVFTCLG